MSTKVKIFFPPRALPLNPSLHVRETSSHLISPCKELVSHQEGRGGGGGKESSSNPSRVMLHKSKTITAWWSTWLVGTFNIFLVSDCCCF